MRAADVEKDLRQAPPHTFTLAPGAWTTEWDGRPTEPVTVGMRRISAATRLQANAEAIARADRAMPEHRLDGLAVDAAHMAAIAADGDEAARWTAQGLQVARESTAPKARALLPALLNNHAWNLHDAGRYADALPVFREAEVEWRRTGRQPQGRIATWSVARCLRSLGRHEEALAIQFDLEREWARAGASDGFVFEEIAELLDALGRVDEAKPWFRRAHETLSRDARFAASEPARLARLRDKST